MVLLRIQYLLRLSILEEDIIASVALDIPLHQLHTELMKILI
jgi:hypothetical protein